ncbi:two-component sensor histidine kinase [Paenibacillus sambharensis]|uniref:Two-component sensor histidine kinase n=1 Tax=Paenibacillus sambharensis TaxID=1803190 RepID=A0A2W1LA59_9BACL|nr:histidine kinase [Paenibacillus sambharensis]PZD95773.1 two-component sensor histidine kinase [Paenibacillus sambharensis]
MPKLNLFTKIVTLIVLMVVPIIVLYLYSNKVSTDVLATELSKSNADQLSFFQTQVDTQVDQLTIWPTLLVHDPDIAALKEVQLVQHYLDLEQISVIKRVQTKLSIQESSSNWDSELIIYSPSINRAVSINDAKLYDREDLKARVHPNWQVRKGTGDAEEEFVFSMVTVTPISTLYRPDEANLIIEVRFDSGNIVKMLDQFKNDGRRDPIYYKKDTGIIYNRTADKEQTAQIIKQLERQNSGLSGSLTMNIDGEKYLVNTVMSRSTGWYLIDYMPLSDILRPIHKSNELFYISAGSLLVMSCLAAYLLYAQVQVPLRQLVIAFQRLKNADYSVRLLPKGRTEFSFLFERFNLMVEQIQELFQHVYKEQLHVKEARLKQLQSQINPHFFYNCFSFISSMAKLENHQAVVAMSQSLAQYYRYTTRQERDLVSLGEELDFVDNYLAIQKMRMNRLHFEIMVPARLRRIEIPPLVIQPLVENAVLHGIEPNADAGEIRVLCEVDGQQIKVTVEDNGKGMTVEDRMALQYKMDKPMDEEMGCGLWNVHQRLQLGFGSEAGIRFEHSQLGGLKVTLQWTILDQ